MAYVIALQLTLAVSLNALLPPGLAFGFGEICHAEAGVGSQDRQDALPGTPAAASAAHCPLCVTPGFALLAPPDAPAITLRRVLGIKFEPIAAPRIDVADIHFAHRARAPPVHA
ncbi:hypothetical protein LQG66_04095 [Bradyrhizobium ontarionense]|uniref:DUF2946 domain-containing protein n=1 Tax=Bradyrhizobium ontarionense TaxID=2898149 RepID=A0ABY3RE47_9BRAD|nr:hypothetical protein [Bradyrhizobium sp. A19]UFZ05509.1 hypothetical protein LQG66_04095 [Bradyrhizobium sp. A19]